MKGTGTPIYLVEAGKKRLVPDEATVKDRGFTYLVEGDKKRFVFDEATLRDRGLIPPYAEILSEDALNQIPVGDPLPSPNGYLGDGELIRGSGLDTYIIGNHQKQLIPDDRTFKYHSFRREDVAQVPEKWLRAYPTGPSLPVYTGPIAGGDDIPVPPPPTDLTATTLNSSRILLKWAHPMQAELGFTVFYGAGSPDVTQVDATTREYIVGGLGPGTRQCFRVVAFNSGGGSLWSNEACATLFR